MVSKLFAAALLVNAAVLTALAADLNVWEPVWSDEFNGTQVDRTKVCELLFKFFTPEPEGVTHAHSFIGLFHPPQWTFETNCDGGGNNEAQCYVDDGETARIENGVLALRAIGNYNGQNGKRVRSARMTTAKSVAFKFGRFESRIRLPRGNYLWPAWWMLFRDQVHGGWPSSGEIDIVEAQSQLPTKLFNTIHFGSAWPQNNYDGSGPKETGIDLTADYHDYALEWDPTEIRWYLDGKLS
jgi:beta-glucanase (GH16 family)